jgi:NAD(P)-dependent dehydrogenase (short-subunit alcohol dehydrogenase family)
MPHAALSEGRTAVITGGASGIGLATAMRLAERGLNVCIADLDGEALGPATRSLAERSPRGAAAIRGVATDVAELESVVALRDAVLAAFGEVALLMNNAGTAGGGRPFENREGWQKVLGVNLWGVLHGLQVFVPGMLAQGTPCAIVNTGSKQGITNPPGDAAYNASKAAIKSVTESLARDLRGLEGGRVSAHLLIPGFTYTGLMRSFLKEKPPGAWLPEQVADHLLAGLERGDFYVLCPDDETPPELDHRRIAWAAGDLIENRPALSRWHPDYAAAYEEFLRKPRG